MTGVGERVVTYRCWLRLMVCCTSLLFVASAWSQPAPAAAQALPPGPGHDIAAAKCVSCHDATRLKSPGYSREGWQRVVSEMMHIGVTLTPEQVPVLTDYLARSFPEQARPQATLIAGGVQVSFREWAVETPAPSRTIPWPPAMARSGTRVSVRACSGASTPGPGPSRIPDQHPGLRASRTHRGFGRRYLVHREFGRLHRQARPEDRHDQRLQDARSASARPAHAALRSQRNSLVHGAGRQHDRAARPANR